MTQNVSCSTRRASVYNFRKKVSVFLTITQRWYMELPGGRGVWIDVNNLVYRQAWISFPPSSYFSFPGVCTVFLFVVCTGEEIDRGLNLNDYVRLEVKVKNLWRYVCTPTYFGDHITC